MKKASAFLSTFIIALSQLFSLAPGNLPPSDQLSPFNPSIEQSFKNVWSYFSKAVSDEQK